MKKINNKGFVLVETLIVTVFIMCIFTIIYMNFYPQIAEYQKREFYDDIDSKYDIYWIKKMVESGRKGDSTQKYINDTTWNNTILRDGLGAKGYYTFKTVQATEFDGAGPKTTFKKYRDASNLKKLYLTHFWLGESNSLAESERAHLPANYKSLKTVIKNTSSLDDSLKNDDELLSYIQYLPNYNYGSLNDAKYRLIAEFERRYGGKTYKSFATIEVMTI